MKEEFDQLLKAMIESSEGASDLLFVVDRHPQVENHGKLTPFKRTPDEALLNSVRIEGWAKVIINENQRLIQDMAKAGSCDCSYQLPGFCRFRVNIYKQNGNYAMVLRKLNTQIPSIEKLKLAPVFREIIKEKNGIVFVTGGTGSGKTTTLAALLNEVNQNGEVHIVTLEDPIEFMHPHIKATFSQREMGRDFFAFADGLRAALRQAPKIILVGEIRDRETMEIALTAAETGHVVYSTLHTISAAQTINRILGMFDTEEEKQVRDRLAETLRYVISQRLVPKQGGGRLLVTELLGSNMRSREAIALGENENRRLSDIIEAASTSGWHTFEQSLLKAYEENLVTEETALLYCVNRTLMRQRIDVAKKRRESGPGASTLKMKASEEPRPAPMEIPPMPAQPADFKPAQPSVAPAMPFRANPAPAVAPMSVAPLQPQMSNPATAPANPVHPKIPQMSPEQVAAIQMKLTK
ncbi:MAG TPA: PilT/PilU family type 4a pilus ATPase [Verrucomicrobiae bacterium]|nr:PilT/PilU family type 4a pilus ATPase [Verrucomicrobiae bacterium]